MACPSFCSDPDCTLTYGAHLRDIQISPAAIPSRAVNRTPGQPDEPWTKAHEREGRWDRENRAYKTLRDAGEQPPTLAAAPTMLQEMGG